MSRYSSVQRCLTQSGGLIVSLAARLMFLTHALVSTFIAVSSLYNPYRYALFFPIILIVLEGILTIKFRNNIEWKWFTPSISIYLFCTVPSIWIMEYNAYQIRTDESSNASLTDRCHQSNTSHVEVNEWGQIDVYSFSKNVEFLCRCNNCNVIMEQCLLMITITGRWFLPRGEHLTRDKKAQLLLVNIAIASDILELFEVMKEDAVKNNFLLVTVVLSIWTLSLVQFALVTTATAKKAWRGCCCFETEMWALVTLLLLDDAPFLIFRLVCIIKFKIISYTNIFFTSKNCLVLALDINRMYALAKGIKKSSRLVENNAVEHSRLVSNNDFGDNQSPIPLLRIRR